jgi:hypothetical protein
MIVKLEFRDAQEPSPEIRTDLIGREFGERDQTGFLSEVLGIFQVVHPGGQVSADQQPVLTDEQAETILFPTEHLLDDGIRIKVLRTFRHITHHMSSNLRFLQN